MHQPALRQMLLQAQHLIKAARMQAGHQKGKGKSRKQHRRNGGVAHVFNVLEQINAHGGRGDGGGIGERRHFVAEKGAGNHRPRRYRRRSAEGFAHAHKGHADGGAGGQAAADGHAHQRAQQKGRQIKILRRNQVEAVIHQRGNRAAHHQRRHQQTDEEKQIHRAHALLHRSGHAFGHRLPHHTAHAAVKQQQHNGKQNRQMRHPAQSDDADAHHGNLHRHHGKGFAQRQAE